MPSSFATTGLRNIPRPFVLLEDRLDRTSSAMLYTMPAAVVCCWAPEAVYEALDQIEAGVKLGLHAAGFLSYELGYVFEPRLAPLLPRKRTLPLIWFGLFEEPLRIQAEALDEAFAALGPPPPITGLNFALNRASHEVKTQRILDYLAAGDVYQVNLTFPVRFRYGGNPLALYAALRVRQPVAYGGIVAFDDVTILSISPELFLDVSNGRATARPMKGTVPRGADFSSDIAARQYLQTDPKQCAENLMIVDLLRNDLARVSAVGSVKVPHLFKVETYPTLHTLTSIVTSVLRDDVSLRDLVEATFPCGSVTGAPKHRAMEIILEIEEAPRGVYTGSMGRIAPDGSLKLNVAIRTAILHADGTGEYGVGGGIVADSEPDSEYEESLLKARVLTECSTDFALIETFRWTATEGFLRLQLHLDRLGASSDQLGFAFDRTHIEAKLNRLAHSFSLGGGDRRVRIELQRNGDVSVGCGDLGAEPGGPLRVVIAAEPVDAGDPFLRHKTTQRQVYEAAFVQACTAGCDEVIFVNRAGHVTEASRNTVFVEWDGRLATPPLAAGLLPGVLRRVLLERGEAVERVITAIDLRGARRCYLGNSLRGLRPATLSKEN